jgi:probable HAF family extracellular repeat protein
MFSCFRIAAFGLTMIGLTFLNVAQSLAQSPLYTVTRLDFPEATSINNHGQIVGIQSPADQAILWENGIVMPLGGGMSRPTRINELGHVVGYQNEESGSRALLWKDGQEIDLGNLGGTSTLAWDLNNQDQAVGYSGVVRRAFLYENGQMQDLTGLISSNPGWVLSTANAINERGQIVGAGRLNGQRRYFLYEAGSVTDLGLIEGNLFTHQRLTESGHTFFTTALNNGYRVQVYDGSGLTELDSLPGFTGSFAYDMNEEGQIVGFAGESVLGHAALWDNGTPIDLNEALQNGEGWILAEAQGINDFGQIVGYGYLQGVPSAFLLTPVAVPEPGVCALLVGGVTGALLWRRRTTRCR